MAYTLIDDAPKAKFTLLDDAPVGAGDTPLKPEQSTSANLIAGGLKGASDIGTTLLRPIDAALNGLGITDMTNADRKASLKEFFDSVAEPNSMAFKGGELGSQIAGTAGVGGVLAKGAQAAGMAPKVINALQSGGFSLGSPAAATKLGAIGDAALRVGSGAAVGGASAGLVDPESAGMGAVIGGAAPPAIKGAMMVGRGASNLASTVLTNVLGTTTGAGAEAIRQAFSAGKNKLTAFLDNMAGKVNMTDVLDNAKEALTKMRMDRAADYKANMAAVSGDKTVLDFAPIQQAMNNVQSMGSYKGQVTNKNAAKTVQEIADTVSNWQALNPTEFHTPEGLDALKKAIGDIREVTPYGTGARTAADTVYNAVKKQIADQAPTYSKTMKDYSEASDLISEIQRTLTGGEKTSADTAMRKLQSLMRNNVNTNYGNRLNLANELQTKGGQELLPAIAGQALNSWTPRGLQAAAQTGGGVAGLGVGGLSALPWLAAAAPFGSPRTMGSAAYGIGRGVGGLGDLGSGLSQFMQQRMGQSPQGLLGQIPLSLLSGVPAVAIGQQYP